jgi:hypothetical protein
MLYVDTRPLKSMCLEVMEGSLIPCGGWYPSNRGVDNEFFRGTTGVGAETYDETKAASWPTESTALTVQTANQGANLQHQIEAARLVRSLHWIEAWLAISERSDGAHRAPSRVTKAGTLGRGNSLRVHATWSSC